MYVIKNLSMLFTSVTFLQTLHSYYILGIIIHIKVYIYVGTVQNSFAAVSFKRISVKNQLKIACPQNH
jgi:hypothetical protein